MQQLHFFADNELQTGLTNVGAKIGSSISKNTNILIVKDEFSKDTGKAIEAIKLGIPIMTKDEFLNQYTLFVPEIL